MAVYLGKLKNLQHLRGTCQFFQSKRWKSKLPDPWDLMTGMERWVNVQYAKGNLDPFFNLPRKRGPGTKDCPNVVPSFMNKRLVCCHCHPDAMHLVYWWIHEGYPKRCDCNHWFVLERVPVPKIYDE